MSPYEISNDVLKGHSLITVIVRDQSPTDIPSKPKKEHLEKLPSKCQDPFPDKFSKEFPSVRNRDVKISLKPDAGPQKKELYSISQYELDEVRAKVEEILE